MVIFMFCCVLIPGDVRCAGKVSKNLLALSCEISDFGVVVRYAMLTACFGNLTLIFSGI